MAAPDIEAFGPPPFRFTPTTEGGLEGPAFGTAFKFLVTVLVGGCIGWTIRLWWRGALGEGIGVNLGWFLAALAMMAWTWWAVIRSRTRIDATGLRQTWVWTKRMEVRDLAYGKLIRVRGLEWLIAPRLYLRTLMGKFAVFYVADPRLTAESERLLAELKTFRGLR